MTDLPDTMGIIVARRDKDGKPLSVYPYDGDTVRHVAACASVARSILATKEGEQSLIRVGERFNYSRSHRWYGTRPMKFLVGMFLGHIVAAWPPIFLEESMTHLDHTAATFRIRWKDEFDTRLQTISLNDGVGRHTDPRIRLLRFSKLTLP